MKNVHIIGAGLLGGSIALALMEAGWTISLEDENQELTEAALRALSITETSTLASEIDAVIVSVPISSNISTIQNALTNYPNAIVIDIASVKTNSLPDIYVENGIFDRFVSTHPFAGKEIHGAENASVDLFQGRIWAICVGSYLSEASKKAAEDLIRDCGATIVEIELEKHDEIVGFTSHLPQVLSTLLSIQLEHLPETALSMSGNGLKDMTRLASSSADIWSEIVAHNAKNLATILDNYAKSIETFRLALTNNSVSEIRNFFVIGGKQKARMPGKHGNISTVYSKIEVQILDRPGELAKIFSLANDENINIEDLRINHALGREIAILEIYIAPDSADEFTRTLQNLGWQVRRSVSKGNL